MKKILWQVTVFKDYTQENCLLECRAKLLLSRCGCLPYFYPRLDLVLRELEGGEFAFLKGNGSSTPSTCSWEGWRCMKNATGKLETF